MPQLAGAPRTEIVCGAPGMPVLDAFMADRSRVSMIMGPLGSGKTYGCIQKLLLLAQEQEPNADGIRPSRFAIIRNTYVDLASTTMKDFREVFIDGEMGFWKLGGIDPPTFHCKVMLEDGTWLNAEFVFMALDRDDDVKKLRGTQFTGAWCNEVKELSKAVLDMLDGRIGRYPTMIAGGVRWTWKGIIGDTNAPDDDHWYYKLAEEETPSNWAFFRQPGGVVEKREVDEEGKPVFVLNPHVEAPPFVDPLDYYLGQLGGKDDDWIRVNLCNRYGFYVEGKPIHPTYQDALHCYPDDFRIEDSMLYLGFDWGRTPACAILQWDRVNDRKICIDEFTSWNMSAAMFAPELKRYLASEYPGYKIGGAWGDPAGDAGGQANEDTPFTVMAAAGIPVQKCPTNATLARRLSLASPMRELSMDAKPRFMLSPKARVIRKGLRGGFAYKRLHVTGERYSEEPDKNMYSHPVEALEYAMIGMGEYHQSLAPKQDGSGRRGRRPRQQFARRA